MCCTFNQFEQQRHVLVSLATAPDIYHRDTTSRQQNVLHVIPMATNVIADNADFRNTSSLLACGKPGMRFQLKLLVCRLGSSSSPRSVAGYSNAFFCCFQVASYHRWTDPALCGLMAHDCYFICLFASALTYWKYILHCDLGLGSECLK